MKATKIFLSGCLALSSIWLMCGCLTNNGDLANKRTATPPISATNVSSRELSGNDRRFSNGDFVMWVPSRAVHVSDGHTSVVDIDETTLSDASVKDYKIEVEIQMSDTPREFEQMEKWSSSNWYFKDFSKTSTRETNYGIQIRKDVWNSEKTRRLLINAMVKKGSTLPTDVETATKMVESVRLFQK
jgi:hypothetical protein